MLVACVIVVLGTQAAAALSGWRVEAAEDRFEIDSARIFVPIAARQEIMGLCAERGVDHDLDPAALPVGCQIPAPAGPAANLAGRPVPVPDPKFTGRVAARAPPPAAAAQAGEGRTETLL